MSHPAKILAFALVIRLLFLLAVPPEETSLPRTLSAYNDEAAHLQHILHYRKTNSRPLQSNSVMEAYPQGNFDYEFYQSPLYYKLNGYLLRIAPDLFANIYFLRFINVILGLWTILIIGQSLKLLSSVYAAGAMVVLSTLGSMVRFNTTVTNDVLLWLFSAYFIYYALMSLTNPKILNLLGMTASLSAALWSKLSALTLIPALIYVVYAASAGKNPVRRILSCFVWLAVTGLITIPLLWENYTLYGEFIPLSVGSGEPLKIIGSLNLSTLISLGNYYTHTFYFPFDNYWVGTLQKVIFLIMGLGTLALIFFAVKRFFAEFKTDSDFKRKALITLIVTLLAGLGGTLLMSLRYHQGEARMAFTALPAICFLLIYGSEKALGRYRKSILRILPLFLALPYLLLII